MNSPRNLLWLLSVTAVAGWCHPPVLEVRLLTPLTSYGMAPGTSFRSVITAPVEVNDRLVLPQGTIVHGTVRRAVPVGVGLLHERATLDIDFNEYELPDGRRFPLRAQLRSIDNARETVTQGGRIKGILAASNPQSLVFGVWYRPTSDMFGRSLMGLTGASGRLWTEYSMGPAGAAALFAIRLAMFRLPEPEIQLPPGTEMQADLISIAADAPSFSTPQLIQLPLELCEWLQAQPVVVRKPSGQPVDDIINIVFIGSREQILEAFSAAGWSQPDPRDGRSFARTYKAYVSQASYASAPISRLLYGNAEPDVVFQKSLNTIAKRHHVRIWRAEWDGEPIWLGAATQDTGITLSTTTMTFTHRIEPMIDWERLKIAKDLTFAGCAASVSYVDREALVRGSEASKGIVTDGRAAVVWLRDCFAAEQFPDLSLVPKVPGSKLTKATRRMLLEARQYILRGNAYYWAYRGLRYRHNVEKASASVRQ